MERDRQRGFNKQEVLDEEGAEADDDDDDDDTISRLNSPVCVSVGACERETRRVPVCDRDHETQTAMSHEVYPASSCQCSHSYSAQLPGYLVNERGGGRKRKLTNNFFLKLSLLITASLLEKRRTVRDRARETARSKRLLSY